MLAAFASLWIAGPANWPLWRALATLPDFAGLPGFGRLAALGLMIAALGFTLLALLNWPRVLKPAIALLLVTAACGAHFMGSYGIVIDPTMMTSVLGTDVREVRDLLSLPMLGSVAVLAGLPLAWLARQPLAAARPRRRLLHNLLAVLAGLAVLTASGLLAYDTLSGTMRNHKSLRYLVNPYNSLYALGHLAASAQAHPAQPPEPIGLDARPWPVQPGQKPPLLLLVVGETARADHFALNGYPRDTTPALRQRGVLSFRDVQSCGTHTAASLPCMFAAEGRSAYEARTHDRENLLDLLQHAGLAVLWIENQAGCKGVCARIPNTRPERPLAGGARPAQALCPGDECYDEALLAGLDAQLAALPEAQRARGAVIALHTMGSHGPAYARRSPPDHKPFQPECASNVLAQCDRAALVNAYDNSIAYADHVLGRAIDWLQHQSDRHDVALLYVSDHGESLGENGLYLHGLPRAIAPVEQTHVPMIAWLPSQRQRADRLDAHCLDTRTALPLSHDHLFHTVLGLARVTAGEYRAAEDVFAPCRAS